MTDLEKAKLEYESSLSAYLYERRLRNPPVAPLRQRLFAMALDSLMPFSLGVLFSSSVLAFCFLDFAQVISSAIIQSCTVK